MTFQQAWRMNMPQQPSVRRQRPKSGQIQGRVGRGADIKIAVDDAEGRDRRITTQIIPFQRTLVDPFRGKRPAIQTEQRLPVADRGAFPSPPPSQERELIRRELVGQTAQHVVIVVPGNRNGANARLDQAADPAFQGPDRFPELVVPVGHIAAEQHGGHPFLNGQIDHPVPRGRGAQVLNWDVGGSYS
jgi:hypothetical protein